MIAARFSPYSTWVIRECLMSTKDQAKSNFDGCVKEINDFVKEHFYCKGGSGWCDLCDCDKNGYRGQCYCNKCSRCLFDDAFVKDYNGDYRPLSCSKYWVNPEEKLYSPGAAIVMFRKKILHKRAPRLKAYMLKQKCELWSRNDLDDLNDAIGMCMGQRVKGFNYCRRHKQYEKRQITINVVN
jgi:hypothetical protein